jgi:hypothetical protein
MALDKERSEQTQWYERIEQERQKLSASLEATLADTSLHEDEWKAEDGQVKTRVDDISKTALIPPRLSLQSKAMPAVRSEGLVSGPSSTPAQTMKPGSEEVQRNASADSNVFMRLARRLTSSFTAFGGTVQSDTGTLPAQPAPSSGSRAVRRNAVVPETVERMPESKSTPVPARPDRRTTVVEALPAPMVHALPAPEFAQLPEGKRRLAGTAKVRLETTPVPAIPAAPPTKPTEGKKAESEDSREQRHQKESGGNSWKTAITKDVMADAPYEEARKTSIELPIIGTLPREVSATAVATSRQFFGKAIFESGQGDKMVEDVRITEGCVVLAMLVDDPGPVVVHYISLYPGLGFTIHLTAPASKQASFNYVILANESV